MRAQTMFFADDVEATSKWYQDFLGLQSGHGGKEYEQLIDGELSGRKILLELHHRDADHDHGVSTEGALGAGVIVFFHVDDVDAAHAKAQALGVEVLEEPHWNEQAGMHEFSVRDPNGYTLSVCKSKWG